MTEPDEEEKRGSRTFWTTLPGVVTAIAALLTAIGGILALVVVPGGSNGGSDQGTTHTQAVQLADQECEQTAALKRQMPPLDASNYKRVVLAISSNQRALANRLRAIPATEEDRANLERLSGLIDQQSNEADTAAVAYGQGNTPAYQQHLQASQGISPAIATAAQSLGASACAQTPTNTGIP
jgi:hypothetical protein